VEATTTLIHARKGWSSLGLGELWRSRELVLFFAWRQILVRYKQTVLGIGWAVLQPLSLMLVLIVISGRYNASTATHGHTAKPSGAVYVLAGLVPWTFFATAVAQGSNSLVGQASLLSKVYFPRLVPPLAAVLAALVDMAITFGLLLLVMVIRPAHPVWSAFWMLPLLALLAFATALGIALWLSALNVAYRDVQYLVPFFVSIGMFASVLFPVVVPPGTWKHTLLGLNPMAGVVEGFRYALAGGPRPGSLVVVSTIFSVTLLVSGLAYFKRRERTFVDVI
jgi:lipopolysaccharide transport system permease protein